MNRFKWAGVYEQRPRDGHFMIRIRINSGIVNSEQVRTLAGIAKDYGNGFANVTTRGAIQFHWIKVENLPDIFERLKSCGLSSFEACGDCPRTIVGNPLAGIDKDELKEVVEFNVCVGGGLSATPHIAQKLDVFVEPKYVVNVAEGICKIFRDYGYREKRNHSRLKFLVADWGTERFKEKLLKLIGDMPSSGEDKLISWNASYYFGVHSQKQKGKSYIGVKVPLGKIIYDELLELSDISEKYGDGKIRTTLFQNLIISGINDEEIVGLLKKQICKSLSMDPNTISGYTMACTCKEFCNLAIVETKERARMIAEYLDSKIEINTPIRIHFTGCPNSCGQKQIADISLQGILMKGKRVLKKLLCYHWEEL